MSAVSNERDDWDAHWVTYAEATKGNPAHAYRRRLIERSLAIPPGRARILDIGCGQGDLVEYLASCHAEAEFAGLEPSAEGLRTAAARVPHAQWVRRDLLAPGDPGGLRGWATHAVCSEVLEHVDDPVRLLDNARGYMAPGCRLVVTVPGGPRSAFDRYIGHRRHYNTGDLGTTLAQAGFRVESCRAAGFPFFNLYKLAVVLRGEKLIADVATGVEQTSTFARLAMTTFRGLFRGNVAGTPWGWQLVAVATSIPAGGMGL